MARLPKLGLAIAAALCGGAVHAALPRVTADEVVAAVSACDSAMTPDKVDVAQLEKVGWSKGSFTEKGKPIASAPVVYGRGGMLLFVNDKPGGSTCLLSGQINGKSVQTDILPRFLVAFGQPVTKTADGQLVFRLSSGNLSLLAATGSPERPAVRVGVAYVAQDKK